MVLGLCAIPVFAYAHPILTVRPHPAAIQVRNASVRTVTPGTLSRLRPGSTPNRAPQPHANPFKRRWLA
jgi:hypothetical protein